MEPLIPILGELDEYGEQLWFVWCTICKKKVSNSVADDDPYLEASQAEHAAATH